MPKIPVGMVKPTVEATPKKSGGIKTSFSNALSFFKKLDVKKDPVPASPTPTPRSARRETPSSPPQAQNDVKKK